MNKIKALSAFAILVLVSRIAALGQDFQIDTRVSGPVTVCGNPITFSVKLTKVTGEAVQNIKLTPQIPVGMIYIPGSAQGMSEITPLSTTDPSFSIADFSPGEITVTFKARANCNLITTLRESGSSSNLVNNNTKLGYTIGGENRELLEPNGSESYSVLFAQLELFVPESEKNQHAPFINKVMNRHITIKNTGLGSLTSVDFYLKTDPELTLDKLEFETSSGFQVITHSVITSTLGRKYTITDFSAVGNGDAYFEENEEIHLIDYVKATTGKGSIETIYTAQWGCDNIICNPNDSQASFAVYVEALGGKADITPNHVVVKTTDFCNAPPAIVKYIFYNKGSDNLPVTRDAAFNLQWTLPFYGFQTVNDHHFYIIKSDNSKLNIDHLLNLSEATYVNNGRTTVSRYYKFDFTNVFATDPDGSGGIGDVDEDGFYDDLPLGATFNIEAHLKLTFNEDILAARGHANMSTGNMLQYNSWSGQIEGFNWGYSFYAINVIDQDFTGPADLVNGNVGSFKITSLTGVSSQYHNHNNSSFEFDIQVPQGVLLRTIKWQNKSLPFTQTGTQVKILNALQKIPAGLSFDLDFELDCAQSSSPEGIIYFNLYHYSDYSCPTTRFKVLELQKPVFLHCGSCSTTETTQFTAERKTLGWALPSYPKRYYTFGELYGPSSLVQKVTRNTPGLRLDAAYPRDEVELSVQGRVAATTSNLKAEIKYTSTLTVEALHLSTATFEVNGSVFSFPSDYVPEKSVQDNIYTYTYTIPLGSSGWPTQLAVGTVFQLKSKVTVDDLASVEKGEYRISDFRGRFYSTTNGVQTGCNGFGDDFFVLRPKYDANYGGVYGYNLDSLNRVMVTFLSSLWTSKNNSEIPDFPGEFRPLNYMQGATMTLPKGYVFDTSKPVEFDVDHGTNLKYNFTGAIFSADKRTITLPHTNDIPIVSRSFIFYAYVNVDCSNPANLFVPVTTNADIRQHRSDYSFKMYPYLLPVSEHVLAPPGSYQIFMYNKRRPALKLTANSIQEGYSDNVKWPIQICNPSIDFWYSAKSKNTWVAFELKSDDTSTMLEAVLDENNNELETIFYGPKDADHPRGRYMLVKLGNMDISACLQLQVVASYKNCEEDRLQDIDVFASWDYNSYPALENYAGLIANQKASCEGNLLTETMTIKYKTADLQWEVRKNGPDEVDLCVTTPFEIDLASTKYGDMKNLKVLVLLPAYATFDPANPPQFSYPYNDAPRNFPAGALLNQDGRIRIDVAALIGGNLPGIRVSDNKIKLAFNLTTSCGYDPGLPIKYTVEGYTNCGDFIQFTDQRKIKLNGITAAEINALELKLSAPSALACNSNNEIFLSIKNVGDSTSRANQLDVTLPEGTEFTAMLTGDLPPPLVAVVNNQVKLRWTLPDNYLAPDSTKSLSFRTYLNQTAPGTSTVLFVSRTYKTLDAFCTESNEACATQATSGLHELSVPVTGLASLDITYGRYICAYQFVTFIDQVGDCSIATYDWNFGDGGTSTEPMPFHSFNQPGTYNVSVNVNFNCGGCSGAQSKQIQMVVAPQDAILKDTVIEVLTDSKKQVLQVAASTFSDSWPTQHINPALNDRNSFQNGTQGVWRNDGVYVYEAPRKASDKVDISKDGTFKLDHFNWEYAEFDAIPGWIKANSMTQYSPFSYELENRDVLGIYSAALYDYGGHLPSANGVNMRNAEMAFTSFEFLDGNASGNWIFGNQPLPIYSIYPIRSGFGNIAVVEASLKQLEDVTKVDITSRGMVSLFLRSRFGYSQDNEIVCKQAYSLNPEWSIIVLKQAPASGMWTGRMKVKNDIVPAVVPVIDRTLAHSGSSSLKITSEKVFNQNILQLDSGKTYFVSAWVSVNQVSVSTPKLADNLGLDVVIRNRQGQIKSTFSFMPSGQVIEGWQQVKGTFTFSGGNGALIELKFKPGSTGTAWYDDIRLHPEKGNMKSYVYDLKDYRLRAILDEENFASFYFYDAEGNLYLVKKETEDGVKTISENVSSLIEPKSK